MRQVGTGKMKTKDGKKRQKGSKSIHSLKKQITMSTLKEFGDHGGTPITEAIKAKAAISVRMSKYQTK